MPAADIRQEESFPVTQAIFERLGVRPVINASGIYTDLGGSRLSPPIWAAMAEANDSFIDLVELLDRTGKTVAGMLGVEAARITPGASAAIALGIGACLTGNDRQKMERLPETSGKPNEIILQRGHRYKYDRCALLPGARTVEVGSEVGTRREEIEQAIGPNTVALYLPAHLDGHNGTVPLRDVAAIGREHGVPTFVDAAYMNYPVEIMDSFNDQGA